MQDVPRLIYLLEFSTIWNLSANRVNDLEFQNLQENEFDLLASWGYSIILKKKTKFPGISTDVRGKLRHLL